MNSSFLNMRYRPDALIADLPLSDRVKRVLAACGVNQLDDITDWSNLGLLRLTDLRRVPGPGIGVASLKEIRRVTLTDESYAEWQAARVAAGAEYEANKQAAATRLERDRPLKARQEAILLELSQMKKRHLAAFEAEAAPLRKEIMRIDKKLGGRSTERVKREGKRK